MLLLLLLSRFSRVQLLRPHRRQPTRLLCSRNSLGNTGVGCHFLLQHILYWIPIESVPVTLSTNLWKRNPLVATQVCMSIATPVTMTSKCLIAQCSCLMCVLIPQSCPSLCDPLGCSSPGSSVHGILQARILEWLPCPSPGDLPDPGIEPTSPVSPALQADSLLLSQLGSPQDCLTIC